MQDVRVGHYMRDNNTGTYYRVEAVAAPEPGKRTQTLTVTLSPVRAELPASVVELLTEVET